MADLSFRVLFNSDFIPKITAKIQNAADKTEHLLAEQIRADTTPYAPWLNGVFDKQTKVIGHSIVYPGPSARYLYHGKLMVDPETGNPWARKGATKVLTNKDLVFTHSTHPMAQAYWFEASKAVNLKKWLRIAEKENKNALNGK